MSSNPHLPGKVTPSDFLPKVIPKAGFDSTLSVLNEGYLFITNRCQQLRSPIFETRLMLKKTICMMGKDAAQLFYDNEKFMRKGATPMRVQKTLVGVGAIQSLDGEAHQQRKRMFIALLMAPERIDVLANVTSQQWQAAVKAWHKKSHIVFFDEMRDLLCRSVCLWAGVPLNEDEVQQRARDLGLLITSGGRVGLKHWRGRWARKRCERWIAGLVESVREKRLNIDNQSALFVIAHHLGADNTLLTPRQAAVEVLNVLRPTVAIAQPMTFAALALHQYPGYVHMLMLEPQGIENFVQEVRRFYPFFPFQGAIVKHDFTWNGYRFKKGWRVLLDLYATSNDPAEWKNPEVFTPERFAHWDKSPFNFIPNGGASVEHHHRCLGEQIVIALMNVGVKALIELDYKVPAQNLSLNFSSIPLLPKSGFIMSGIRAK